MTARFAPRDLLRRIAPALAAHARGVLDGLLPQRCPGCGAEADARLLLCTSCLRAVPALSWPLCARCLVQGSDPSSCRRHAGASVHALWAYDERAAALVHALKYGERPGLARALGPLLAAAVTRRWARADLVTEVPLHPARARERGYNQSERLARALAGSLAVPHLPGVLERRRATRPQARLPQAERRDNVRGAFACREPSWLAGRRVLLVDDVMTTGATMEAALDALASAGARAAGVVLAWAQ